MHVSFMVEYIFNATPCKLEENAHVTLDICHTYAAGLDHSSVIPTRACGVALWDSGSKTQRFWLNPPLNYTCMYTSQDTSTYPVHLGAGGRALYPGSTLAMCVVCSYMCV